MKWQGLLLGQGVCLLNTSTAVLASLLVACDISAPLYQLLWLYIGLAIGFGVLLVRSVLRKEIPLAFWRTFRVSISCLPDSQGQFLMLLSFSYTSLTSVSVLMQSGFVMVAIMSRVFNGRRYGFLQICGLVGCTAGVGILIVGDLQMEKWELGGLVLGDMLTLLGVFLYSV